MSKPFPVDKYPQVEADECVTKALNWFLNHIKVLVNYDETCYDFVCLWIAQMFQYPEHKSVELFFISSEGAGNRGNMVAGLSHRLPTTLHLVARGL